MLNDLYQPPLPGPSGTVMTDGLTKRDCASKFIWPVEQEKPIAENETKQPALKNTLSLRQNFDLWALVNTKTSRVFLVAVYFGFQQW
jgi:hypothetical protein